MTVTIKTSISAYLTLEFTVSGIAEKIGLLTIMVDTDAKNLAISVEDYLEHSLSYSLIEKLS